MGCQLKGVLVKVEVIVVSKTCEIRLRTARNLLEVVVEGDGRVVEVMVEVEVEVVEATIVLNTAKPVK
jgi:hypothetical protein